MKSFFDSLQGREIDLYTLENDQLKIELINHGARIVSCYLKEAKTDVIQGFDQIDGYLREVRYMGATVGRVCNRIGGGAFEFNGKTYSLYKNDHGNTLHGGKYGLDLRFFDAQEKADQVVFYYLSEDGEEGFPGTLKLRIIYRLLSDGWAYEIEAESDQDTLCSITNHAFFNLNGQSSESALNHVVQIEADEFAEIDQNGLTLPKIRSVKNTPFDFTKEKRVGAQIDEEDPQLRFGHGYDHNFLLRTSGLKRACFVSGEACTMEILTTLPCMHFYSGNFLDGTSHGKQGAHYPRRSALCFETQYYPNAINYDCAAKPILKAGKRMRHKTEFHFRGKGKRNVR